MRRHGGPLLADTRKHGLGDGRTCGPVGRRAQRPGGPPPWPSMSGAGMALHTNGSPVSDVLLTLGVLLNLLSQCDRRLSEVLDAA